MPEPIDPVTIPPREVAVLRDLLTQAFDPDASPDERCDIRIRISARLVNIIGTNR